MPKSEKSISTRFWRRVDRRSADECWEWIGSTANTGYGQMSCRRKDGGWTMVNSHRLSWIESYGEIPEGLCVLHKCDNRKCCNPDHLFLGTRSDNVRDMVEKGRQAMGEGKPRTSKLNSEQVLDIRRALAPFACTRVPRGMLATLSLKYQVSKSLLSKIGKGKGWGHAA